MRLIRSFNPVLLGVILLGISLSAWALEQNDIATIEAIVKKHKLEEGLKPIQLFQGYAILARELEAYGHQEKAAEYYLKALKTYPADERALEVATSYLSNLYRRNQKDAQKYFEGEFQKVWKSSNSSLKKPIQDFWQQAFNRDPKVIAKRHNGFYGQFFKDQDIKDLMADKKFYVAFSLVRPQGLKDANINRQLQYDVLAYLNGQKKEFFCQGMLDKFSNSPSVPVEVCRYLKTGQLKYGDLKALKVRSEKELPHLSYLVEALLSQKEMK